MHNRMSLNTYKAVLILLGFGLGLLISPALAQPISPDQFFGLLNKSSQGLTIVGSSARTTSGNTGLLNQSSLCVICRGVTLYINVTAVSGTSPTLVLAIGGVDPISGNTTQLHPTVTGNITTTGLFVYQLYPGISQSLSTFPITLNSALPRDWLLSWSIGGTTPSFTFSVGVEYIY